MIKNHHRTAVLIGLFLILSILIIYGQVKDFEFVTYDDSAYITDNPHIKKKLTLETIKWAFTSTHHKHWHPLTWISHILDYRLFGMDPAGHHVISVFIHIANTLLLFWFIKRTTGDCLKSGFVAALFALHPLHVEAVAWVADRKDVLCTLFWMLAMVTYAVYARRPSPITHLLVVLIFVMGLLSKPMVITMPLVFLLLDYWPLRRFTFNPGNRVQSDDGRKKAMLNMIGEKAIFLIFIVVSGIITIIVMQKPGIPAFNVAAWVPTPMQLANVPLHYTGYIIQTIFPFHLAIPVRFISMPPVWKIIASLGALILISYFVFKKARRYPYLPVGWLWYLITLLPVVGLIRIGPVLMADHYTYIPLIGLFIIAVWGIPDLLQGWQHHQAALKLLAGTVIVGMMVLSFIQVGYWKNSVTLYRHAISVRPNHALAHNNLGIVMSKQGKLKEAVYHFAQALRIKPDYANAFSNLGLALARQGKLEDAVFYYKKALKIKAKDAEVHFNLAQVYARQRNYDSAIAHYRQALRVRPRWATGHNHLGIALARKGRFEEAIDHFSMAIEMDYGLIEARKNLVIAQKLKRKASRKDNHP